MATNLGTAVGYLTLDIEGFTKGIDNATRQMERMGTGSESALANIGTGISKLGTGLTAAVTAPIIGFGSSAIKEGVAFEEAMTQVKNVAKLANTDINEFRDVVKSLGFQMEETGDDVSSMYETMYNYAVRQGSETRYTAEEVASAFYYMGLAGWKATDMMKGLRPMLNLAAATGEDLSRVSDIVTDSMSAMGIGIDELSSYTNVLAEMTRSSNTTLDQAGEAFKYVAPLAGSLGYDMHDVAVAIGEFANVGVKGSQAGTGLRQALNSLTNPSKNAQEVMKAYGISIYDGTGKAKSLAEVMDLLRKKFKMGDEELKAFMEDYNAFFNNMDEDKFYSLSEEEQLRKFMAFMEDTEYSQQHPLAKGWLTDLEKMSAVIKLVGVRALPGMLGIINETDERFGDLTNSVNSADEAYDGLGTAVGMSDELMDTGQGSIYKLTSSISELKIQLYDLLGGPFRQIVDKLTEVVKWFNELDDATQNNIVHWLEVAAVIGPALVIFGRMLTGIAQITSAFKLAGMSKDGFAKNITGTLKPALKEGESAASRFGGGIGGIVQKFLGVGSIVLGAITAVWSFVDAFKNGYDIVHGLLITIGTFLAGLGAYLLGVPAAVAIPVAAVVAIIANLVLIIKDHWEDIKAGFKKFIEVIADLFKGMLDVIDKLINGFVSFIFETIPGLFDKLWGWLSDFIKKGVEAISSFVKKVGEFFGKLFEDVLKLLTDIAKHVGDFFAKLMDGAADIARKVGEFLSGLWNDITTWLSNVVSKVGSWFTEVVRNIGSFISNVLQVVASAGTTIIGVLTGIFSSIGSAIAGLAATFKGIFDGLMQGVKSALKAIGDFVSGFVNSVVETVSNMINGIMGFINGLTSSIGSALNGIFSAMQGFFQSFANGLVNVLSDIGSWIDGFISKMGGFMSSLWDTITSIITDIASGMGSLLSTIGEGISSTVQKVAGGLTTFLNGIGTTIGDGIKMVVSKLAGGFSGIWTDIVEIGKNIIKGIFEGLKSGVEWIGEKVGSIAEGIVSGIKKVFKIGSPSKLMADEVGVWLPAGIAEGFEEAVPEATDDMTDSLDDMIDGVNAEDSMVNIGASYSDLQTVMSDSYASFADSVESTEERLNASLDSMYEKMYNLMMLEQQFNNGVIGDTGYEKKYTSTNTTQGVGISQGVAGNGSGNTFIFNSPKPIDEIEAARQLEKTQRELEEGFI